MKSALTLLMMALVLSLSACATGPSKAEIAAAQAAAQQAQLEAEMESEMEVERLRQERLLADERAAQAAEERRLKDAAEAEARRMAQAAEAARQRQPSTQTAPNTQQREQAVARQQAQIAELRAQIAANKAETSRIDSSNTALREAIAAAEELTQILASEQEKYTNADPATGQTQLELSKSSIESLSAEVERLRALAAELAAQTP